MPYSQLRAVTCQSNSNSQCFNHGHPCISRRTSSGARKAGRQRSYQLHRAGSSSEDKQRWPFLALMASRSRLCPVSMRPTIFDTSQYAHVRMCTEGLCQCTSLITRARMERVVQPSDMVILNQRRAQKFSWRGEGAAQQNRTRKAVRHSQLRRGTLQGQQRYCNVVWMARMQGIVMHTGPTDEMSIFLEFLGT